MAHTCHAIGCSKKVPPAMFMCKSHWFRVPKFLRDGIWATYRPGQEKDWKPCWNCRGYGRVASANVEITRLESRPRHRGGRMTRDCFIVSDGRISTFFQCEHASGKCKVKPDEKIPQFSDTHKAIKVGWAESGGHWFCPSHSGTEGDG